MSGRRPKSFARWAIGVVGTVIIALIMFQLRIHRAEYRIERDLSGIEQQLRLNFTQQSPVTHQLSPEEAAAHQELARRQAEINRKIAADFEKAAAEERRKEDAWSQYFTPTQRCQIPDSQRMVRVCQANEAKLRARFDADWAAGERI
ncbi:hypothetical protein [Stutzerimonas stutzeri]|uniref:hypothetical protein n=1 Tax=Stutzerimonas stutzeri TaxID=316 RepID=UPI001C84B621|nr:hypothetical protein [Stutzerimonas stutzeri]